MDYRSLHMKTVAELRQIAKDIELKIPARTGKAVLVEDVKEKEEAMTLLMKTQTGKDYEFNQRLVSIVSVIRIQVSEYTAKHRPLPGQEPTRK